MDHLDLAPIRRAAGAVKLPGSKSISNRMLMLAALAEGETLLRDLLAADDTRVMVEALRSLGIAVSEGADHGLRVKGGGGVFPVKEAELFLGNAGTAFRPLTAALALAGGEYRLSGVPRMHERPIADLVEALTRLGAHIDYLKIPGYPPLQIHAPGMEEGRPAPAVVSIRGNVSSQFLTALLMAAPLTGRRLTLQVEGELISRPYIEITLNAMQRFGVSVERGSDSFIVPARARYRAPGEIQVEGDASAASYFLAAGAISGLNPQNPAGTVRVEGVGRSSIQGDIKFADALMAMGADITLGDTWIDAGAGAAARQAGRLKAFDADFNAIPDAAMTAAICALFADGPCTLRNIGSWRVKETDRIQAMAAELRKLGAAAEEGADWLKVTPPAQLKPATIDTYDDHRMAMCFSLAALGGVAVRINDPGCVAKTYPEYFTALAGISER